MKPSHSFLIYYFKFSSVSYFSKYHVCMWRTPFRVFRGHVVFEGIYFFFCIKCDNRPCTSSVVACPSCWVELLLVIFWALLTALSCFLVVASERGFFFLSKNLQFSSKQNGNLFEDHRSYIRNFCSCEKKAWKEFRLVRDSNPWLLRYRCSALPIKLTSQLGAGSWIGSL